VDKATLLTHLAMAERHVAQGERHVARQREIVAELERDGHPVADSKNLLRLFVELQTMHIADRDRLVAELAKTASPALPSDRGSSSQSG
jgi:hypothetical protein